jgi:periodic tryptophan protein 1
VAKDVEMQMDEMDLESDDGEAEAPIFTSELAALKAKELGKEFVDEAADDQDMEEANAENEDDGPMAEHPEAFEESEEEKDDYTIRKTDSIIVAATAENDHSNLEVYIYEHENANLYVHHEIILGSYPLCIEWLPHF